MNENKCYACGYVKKSMYVDDNKIIRYKSGPRKGEVKEIIETRRDIFENDPSFKEINIGKGELDFTATREDNSDYSLLCKEHDYVTVYACPNCGTLKIKV